MTTNASCTIFRQRADGTYQRIFYPAVMWQENKNIATRKFGAQNADKVRLWIPLKCPEPLEGDIIVKGEISDSIKYAKELMKSHKSYKVMGADKLDYGSPDMWHWDVVLK